MNKVILVGRLVKDPEKRTTQNGSSVTSFTVAVNRKFKNADGNYDADFLNCVAWQKTADFVAQYFTKGSPIGVVGSLQTRSYTDKSGIKRYITEILIDDAEFVAKKENDAKRENKASEDLLDWGDMVPADDTELPF